MANFDCGNARLIRGATKVENITSSKNPQANVVRGRAKHAIATQTPPTRIVVPLAKFGVVSLIEGRPSDSNQVTNWGDVEGSLDGTWSSLTRLTEKNPQKSVRDVPATGYQLYTDGLYKKYPIL